MHLPSKMSATSTNKKKILFRYDPAQNATWDFEEEAEESAQVQVGGHKRGYEGQSSGVDGF